MIQIGEVVARAVAGAIANVITAENLIIALKSAADELKKLSAGSATQADDLIADKFLAEINRLKV